jgi:hypothetical protein
MADLRELPPDALQGIARQIGERLYDALSSSANVVSPPDVEGEDAPSDFEALAGIGDPASVHFELAETLEVWRLRAGAADDFVLTREDLLTLGRPTGAYHHQITAGGGAGGRGAAVAFARSWPLGADQTEWSVRDLFFSPLAARVDEALGRADEQVVGDAVARLLSLPEYRIEALWLIDLPAEAGQPPDGAHDSSPPAPRHITSRVMVISAPTRFAQRTMTLLSSSEFMHALVGTNKGMGFRV